MPDMEKVIEGLEETIIMLRQAIDRGGEMSANGAYRCLSHVIDAFSLLGEQEAVEPKWTSVKERYPENEGFYLVSADHGNYHPWIAEMKTFRGVKGFCNGAAMPCVGAWMPLPEPYNKGR